MKHFRKILDALDLKLAVAFVCVAVAAAVALSLVMPKKYRTQAALMVLEPVAERGMDPDYRKLEFAIETYTRILKSSQLLLPVILELNLDLPPHNLTPEKLAKRMKVKAVRDSQLIRIELLFTDPELAAEIVNRVADRFLSFHRALMSGEAEASQQFFKEQLEDAHTKLKEADRKLIEFQKQAQIDKLKKRLDVTLAKIQEFKKSLDYNRIEREKVLRSIEEAKRKLAELSKEQITLRSHIFASAGSNDDVGKKLEKVETELASVSVSDEEVKAIVDELKREVSALKQKLETRGEVSQEDLNRLDALLGKLPRNIMSGASASDELANAAGGLRKIIVELNPIYQEVARDLVSSEIWLAQVEGERKALEQALANAEREYEELNAKLAELSRQNDELWRNQEIYANTYQQLAAKIEQLRVDVAAKIGDVVLVERALVPTRPVSPKPARNALAALVLSALCIGGLFYIKHSYPEDRDESKGKQV